MLSDIVQIMREPVIPRGAPVSLSQQQAKDPVLPGEKRVLVMFSLWKTPSNDVWMCVVCIAYIAWSCLLPHAPWHILESRLAILCLFGCTPVPIRTFARTAVQFAWRLTCKLLNVISWL